MRSIKEMRKILLYFWNAVSSRPRGLGPDQGGPIACPSRLAALDSAFRSLGGKAGLMVGMGLLENAGNHLIQRRILDAHVHERVPLQDGSQHLGHASAVDLEAGDRAFAVGDLAKFLQSRGRAVAGEMEPDQLGLTE